MSDEELADRIEKIKYREEIAGKDKRGILLGLTAQERDQVVEALRWQLQL